MTLTIKLDGNWSSFQLANSAPPLSVTDSAIAPSARILTKASCKMLKYLVVVAGEFIMDGQQSVEQCAPSTSTETQENVTPKGALRLAKCHASATREGPRASSREHLPKQKLM